jgi:HD-GYP domain-containing protein (c-di-GMP phosphodiesterase class II)
LLKPSKLDDKEWAQIRKHPGCGAQIIQHISLMNPDIIAAVKHHHERQDGTGYPDRLAQNTIPSIARIISVADSFDAMTSDRPYRKAMSDDDAIMNLNQSIGSQLDNNAVEAFLAAYNSAGLEMVYKAEQSPYNLTFTPPPQSTFSTSYTPTSHATSTTATLPY